jgi:putative hydrolase of the HAD superfamily
LVAQTFLFGFVQEVDLIRAALFDMGNVLVHFSHERMYRQIGRCFGVWGHEARQLLNKSGVLARYECGRLTTPQAHRAIEQLFGREVNLHSLQKAIADIFWRNESIERIVAGLASRGVPLVLVSNTCEPHFRWVERYFPVLRHFERRVLSFEVKSCKPDVEIYRAAIRAAACEPHECFFTDDIADNIAAARRLGIDAAVYRDAPSLARELESRGIGV